MPRAGIAIRPCGARDIAALQEIRALAFRPVFASLRALLGRKIAGFAFAAAEAEQAKLLDDACATGGRSRVIVAELGGHPVGFVAMSFDRAKRVGEIGLNAVHPECAGRGIGTALYRFALGEMRKAGMRVAAVATGGDAGHAPARRAYEKAGFGPAIPTLWLYRTL
jgi:GNAT superfamily N-acetyltransferase